MPFSLVQEQQHVVLSALALCPTSDLLAYATPDGVVHLVRWMTWQRVTAVPASNHSAIAHLLWAPDGALWISATVL